MSNPHLDNLTLVDRVIAFFIWGIAGFLGGVLALPPVTSGGFTVAACIGIVCGTIGAIWPRAISSIIKAIWNT